MGGAASVVEAEGQKPTDASDLADDAACKQEVQRLRALIRQAAKDDAKAWLLAKAGQAKGQANADAQQDAKSWLTKKAQSASAQADAKVWLCAKAEAAKADAMAEGATPIPLLLAKSSPLKGAPPSS